MEGLPRGVYRRSTTGKLYFEMRITNLKLCSTQIKSEEEGGLCHDIARRYSIESVATNTAKRKAPQDSLLNYPEYSKFLVLDDRAKDFYSFVRDHKEQAMALILKQAQAAAKALPKLQPRAAQSPRAKVPKNSGQDVGSSSQMNAYRPSKEHLDSAGDCRKNDSCQKFCEDVFEHFNQCKVEYELKVTERVELERKVTDIKEDSGFIDYQNSSSEKFHEHMACFKQLVISSDRKSGSLSLEAFERGYMSEEYRCRNLRKILEGHNFKSISESLKGDGNRMTGRRRRNENERLPPVLEIPNAEQNSCSMPTEASAFCAPPTSPRVLDCGMPYGENDNPILSSTMLACEPRMESPRTKSGEATAMPGMSQPSASFEFESSDFASIEDAFSDKDTNEEVPKNWSVLVPNSTHTGYRMENEGGGPAEQYSANSNVEVQFQDHWSPDYTGTLFHY